MQIYLLEGEIQTGKTTSLMNFVRNSQVCGGILSPVKDKRRFFYSISSQEFWPMEAGMDEKEKLEIGKYVFSKSAFDKAIQCIEKDMQNNLRLIFLDEIGPLELKDLGFADLLKKILAQPYKIQNLVLVVRSHAVNAILNHFNIKATEVKSWAEFN
jgi:nucleoside-triphosphatase THEP1